MVQERAWVIGKLKYPSQIGAIITSGLVLVYKYQIKSTGWK